MRRIEKVFLVFTLLVISLGVIFYACNIDLYKETGNINPVDGFSEFLKDLPDKEFVLSRYENWDDSTSWVLRDIYTFLTVEDGQLNTTLIISTQAVIAFAYYYSLMFVVVVLLVFILVHISKRRKNNEQSNPSV